jgi:altronate dehydratase
MVKRTFVGEGWIRLHPDDDVVVLLRPLGQGARIECDGQGVSLSGKVAAGHKVALRRLAGGGPVRKYGQVIGFARSAIEPGDWVHAHNLEARAFDRWAEVAGQAEPWPVAPLGSVPRFQGYARPGGGVGTRNYVGILTTVNCSASAARAVRDRFPDERVRAAYPNVDGVVAFTFKGGCGMSTGEPQRVLQRVMNGLVRHPNFGGVIVLGLGCEVNQLKELREAGGWTEGGERAVPAFEVQAVGGLRRTVEAARRAVEELLPAANRFERTPQPVSELKLALNCGGSDAHSGITANPALGWASDQLVRFGGTSVLAETTEIYGAEHLLARRAVRQAVAEKLLARIRWWEDHVQRHGAVIDNNPSPGNKAGGLTTIYEKSLGAVAKGGQAPLMEVYEYAERVDSRGFCFMDTPGLDPVSMTGLVSGGCNIAVFTTGRGSVYGCKPSPCIKVATHTGLYDWMTEDMDVNAGTILDGAESVEEVGRRLFAEIVEVAGGRRTKSELAGVGDEEFAPWILGPTL